MDLKNKSLPNEKGSVLLYLIIVSGILGTLAAGVMSFLNITHRSNRSLQSILEQRALHNELLGFLGDVRHCTGALRGMFGGDFPDLKDGGGVTTYSSNNDLDDYGTLTLNNFNLIPANLNLNQPLTLNVNYRRVGSMPGSATLKMPVRILPDPTYLGGSGVSSCWADAGLAQTSGYDMGYDNFWHPALPSLWQKVPVSTDLFFIPPPAVSATVVIGAAALWGPANLNSGNFGSSNRLLQVSGDVLARGSVAVGGHVSANILNLTGQGFPFGGGGSGTINVSLLVGQDVVSASRSIFSDRRLKENIREMTDLLDTLNQLQGVTFSWIKDPKKSQNLGFIAQEVEKIIPEAVTTDDQTGIKYLSFETIVPVAVGAIKELSQMNDAQKAAIEQIDQDYLELRDEFCKLRPASEFCREEVSGEIIEEYPTESTGEISG